MLAMVTLTAAMAATPATTDPGEESKTLNPTNTHIYRTSENCGLHHRRELEKGRGGR